MRGGRNELIFSTHELTITPRGLDRLWCFRRQISLSYAAVKTVRLAEKKSLKRGIRTLGTDTGFKICGTFHSAGNTNFWNYHSPDPVLVIELLPDQEFANIYLSVANPEKICAQLSDRLKTLQCDS